MPQTRKEKACVLGAAGFIGRHVVREFLAQGYRVTAVDRVDGLSDGMLEHRRIEFRCGKLTDDEFVRSVLAGVDTVICLAPNSLPESSNADLGAEIGNQVQATLHIAELAHQSGCRSFVFASSGGTVYGLDSATPIAEDAATRPRNAYGVSKLAIEHYLRVLRELRSLHAVSLRISNPYGVGQHANNNQGFIAMAMRRAFDGEPITIWGDGKAVRDFIFVRDLAAAFVKASEYTGPEHVMNIGSGLGYSLLEIMTMVEEVSGRRLNLRFERQRKIDVARNVLDISRAYAELNWQPQTAIEAGLAATADWWASRQVARA
jgi:UDP-glucose 4-epimerase